MITAAVPGVWSTAFFTAVVRYVAVGVGTGALVGVALVVLSTLLPTASGAGGDGFQDLGVVLLFGALVGAALSLPAAAVGAATGLVLAVRRPRSRWLVLVGLLWCPVALVGWLAWLWMSLSLHGWAQQLTALLVVEAVVVAAVAVAQRWVTAPVAGEVRAPRGGASDVSAELDG
ncbi:hypothetical protein [Quadrisphaera sp. INWT6]|uniref:hypothetical protein n=1 Tax=Quadrisphaera sp. INWT6 TaxID=2596917 RepID=UPI0018921F9B|nr:hypothetical protein [Quadrisphaera sp. INWT6]MBF5083622.1 hypothetical protein [Quadrisphaera sp. INWT6]